MAKTVCKTNIAKALRDSFKQVECNSWYFEDVCDGWQAALGLPNYQGIYEAELWCYDTEESFVVTFGGCTSFREVIEYGSQLLMERYERRYGRKAA